MEYREGKWLGHSALDLINLVVALLYSSSAALLSALCFGLAAAWHVAYKDIRVTGLGPNRFEDLALRFSLISILLVLFICVCVLGKHKYFQILKTSLLFVALYQSYIVLMETSIGLPDWVTNYSATLGLILISGYFLLGLGGTVVILQVATFWRKSFSPKR